MLAPDLQTITPSAMRLACKISHLFRFINLYMYSFITLGTRQISALVTKLELPTLKKRRTIAKASMVHKVITGLVDVVPDSGTLTPAL